MRYLVQLPTGGGNATQTTVEAIKAAVVSIGGANVAFGTLLGLFKNLSVFNNSGTIRILFDSPVKLQAIGGGVQLEIIEADGEEEYTNFVGAATINSMQAGTIYFVPNFNLPNINSSLEIPNWSFLGSDAAGHQEGNSLIPDAVPYMAMKNEQFSGVTTMSNVVSCKLNKVGFLNAIAKQDASKAAKAQQMSNVFLTA